MDTIQAEILVDITSFLERYHISYMITGSLSVIYYGRPRASHDIDIVVELVKEDGEKLLHAVKTLSTTFLIQPEAIEEAIQQKTIFGIIHRSTLLKIDMWMLTGDPFDQSRFSRKEKKSILDKKMWMASAEDAMLQKLRWYKQADIEKHLIDAAFIYQIQEKFLDMKYIHHWAKKLGVEKYLKRLTAIDLELYL